MPTHKAFAVVTFSQPQQQLQVHYMAHEAIAKMKFLQPKAIGNQ
jgi:hypothetical protein